MKLKYYLRGVGIGIIFATLVMTVSSIMHKYNISDEYIIKEARKLGMVMKNEINGNNGLFGNDETESSEDTESSQSTEETQETESVSQEVPTESERPSESETPSGSETPSESETPSQSETPSESEQPSTSEQTGYVTIIVEPGDYARQVAEKVAEAGLVEDAEDFRKYMGKKGYGQKLHAGSYQIPIGADYEEICKILIAR